MDSEQLRTRLHDLALDLRWSWNHAADELWTRLDPELWALTHNAWVILQTVSRERLSVASQHAAFHERWREPLQYYEYHNTRPHWFRTAYPNSPITAVAYFSMEFMLSDALPIYQVVSATLPAISSKPPATWVFRCMAWDSCISRVLPSAHRRGWPSGGAVPL